MTIFIIFVIFILNIINKINMYKITIEKIERFNKIQKNYEKLREPFEGEDGNPDVEGNPQYGYVEVEVTEEISTKVFEVMLDDIDVAEVATKIISK